MSQILFSIILAVLLVGAVSEVCTPKFLLQNIIHQSVSVYSFTSMNSIVTATMPFNFEESFFKIRPKIITSINQLSCNQFKEINYLLTTEIQGSSVVFKFSSANMRWTSLEINFFLHSRDDLFSITRTITTNQMEKQTSVSYRLEGSDKSKQYVVVNFIVGVLISSSKSYSISIIPFSISVGQYQITVISNTKATITVQSLYFLASQDNFVYSYNTYQFSATSNLKTIALWDNFSPNVYTIYGFTSWTLNSNSLSLSSHFNIIKNSITIQSFSGVQSLKLSYFALGQLPHKICSPCDSFITISGCIEKCPSGSYGQKLPGGGKICRLCDQTLGQSVNSQGDACICQNGLTFYEGRCVNEKQFPIKCRPYQALTNGKCISRSYGLTNQCPAKSTLNSAGVCICQSGYLMSATNQCISLCPLNSIYNQIQSACTCNPNYQMIKGICVPCSSNQSYNFQSKICVAKLVDPSGKLIICEANQVIIDNSCQCSQNSYVVNKRCVPCPAETYKIPNLNKCGQCPAYCSTCLSSFQCSSCNLGFKISNGGCDEICGDGIKLILPCDDGNTVSGDGCSSDCQIEPDYVCNGGNYKRPDICIRITFKDVLEIKRPTISFLSSGIITQLIVTPPIKRTPEELSSLFSVSFTKREVTPQNIFFSQNSNDYRSIRCYFAYNNNVPNDIFSATFQMVDTKFGSSKIVLLYNPYRVGITSAISIGSRDYKDDILTR